MASVMQAPLITPNEKGWSYERDDTPWCRACGRCVACGCDCTCKRCGDVGEMSEWQLCPPCNYDAQEDSRQYHESTHGPGSF